MGGKKLPSPPKFKARLQRCSCFPVHCTVHLSERARGGIFTITVASWAWKCLSLQAHKLGFSTRIVSSSQLSTRKKDRKSFFICSQVWEGRHQPLKSFF